MAKAKAENPVDMTKVEFDSFTPPDSYIVGQMQQRQPSCFNSIVRILRYRYTIELIEEPIEEIQARLLQLWRNTDNHHHWRPLQGVAAKFGFQLPAEEFGKDKKR